MNANLIHKWLKEQEKMLNGKLVWRLVWSEALTEKRTGQFNDFYGDLFIRSFTGTREVRKYNYVKDRWILEKFCPGNNPEVSNESGGTYEPFFVFESCDGKFLHPTLKVVQFIVDMARQRVVSTPSERKDMVSRSEDEEIKQFLGELEDKGRTPTESLLHTREAVSLYAPKDPRISQPSPEALELYRKINEAQR